MTIIDCHTHIGRNDHINASVKELLISMDEANIDKAMVFAGELNDAPNEWVLDQIKDHRDRLIGVAAASPQLRLLEKKISDSLSFYSMERQMALQHDKEEIKKITDWYGEGLIKAVKFYTGYDHYYPSEQDHYLQALNELGCPAIFHSGDCLNSIKHAKLKYAHPLHIDDVANEYPKMNFIIAHMGYPWIRDASEVCYKNENVYSDVSGFVYGEFTTKDYDKFSRYVKEFIEISSASKLLFGTDWPISAQESYLRAFTNDFGDIWEAEHLSDNVQKVFKL